MSDILGKLLAGVLALAGVAAVIAIFLTSSNSSKTSQAVSEINAMVGNIEAAYTANPNYTTLSNAVVIAGKMAPQTKISGSSLINPFKGTSTVAVASGNTSSFTVTETGVPGSACPSLAGIANLLSLSINGATQTLPIDSGTATTACSLSSNTLILTF